MTIDIVLKAIRKELDISQETLARDLSVSFTTLNRWENGHTIPSRLARIRLTEYCTEKGVTAEIISALKRD